jgi:hypothetical protein
LNKLIITILLLPFILLGCSNRGEVQQNPSGTLSNPESIWLTVPEPSTIVVNNQGKSQYLKTTDSKYTALAKEIETVLKNSDLAKADGYRLAVINGDISKYRDQSGVELIYNSPINVTTSYGIKSIFRLFIYCDKKPMLFMAGFRDSDTYENGPLTICNTDSLQQLITSIANDNSKLPGIADNVEGASITNNYRNTHYTISKKEAQELFSTLKSKSLSDYKKYDDACFINKIVFHDNSGKPIISIQAVTPQKGTQFRYQLVVNDSLIDGKPYTCQLFYDKLREIAKKNNFVLFDALGG